MKKTYKVWFTMFDNGKLDKFSDGIPIPFSKMKKAAEFGSPIPGTITVYFPKKAKKK